MFIGLSFIGKLPSYTIDCVHQIRTFTDIDIYLILDDFESPYLLRIQKYNVKLVNYTDVIDPIFMDVMTQYKDKFLVIDTLIGREQLFMRSIERFFLVYTLMKNNNLSDCVFLEIDNLIYDDPLNWLVGFQKNELAYMYDNTDRCASGIMYIKNSSSLTGLLNIFINEIITTTNEYLNEMDCLSINYKINKNNVQLLPIYWKSENIIDLTYKNYDYYNNSIFDSGAIGIFLLGLDPWHTRHISTDIITGTRWAFNVVDYTQHTFEWKTDEKGRKKPFIYDSKKWILINNLHVHSKALHTGLSNPILL
jgi:hypothetical protein